MNCANPNCHAFVDRDGLNGFCSEHKVEAVMDGVLTLERQLLKQSEQLSTLSKEIRALRQGR
jgi:hypothetical protein